MSLKSAGQWGTGPFDNAVAQELAFKISDDATCKNLNFLTDRMSSPVQNFSECLEFVTLAELINVVSGNSAQNANCPLLVDWALKYKVKPPTASTKKEIANKLRESCIQPRFLKLWRGLAGEWQAEIESIASMLESDKKPRTVKRDEIALKTLTTLVNHRPGREPDSLYPMDRGSKDIHVNFSHCDPQTAIAMTRYPSVVSISLVLRQKSDEVDSVLPFKILLRQWRDKLCRLNCDVSTKKWDSQVLDKCLPELHSLSRIEVFNSVRFDISDAVISALALSKKLTEIRISSDKNGPTDASLESLRGNKALKIVWLRGSRISKKAVKAFASEHPKAYIDIA